MRVDVALHVRRPGIAVRRLQQVVRHVLRRQHRAADTELTVVLVPDAAIRRLNRRFRKIDRATDVLAFPSYSDGAPVSGSGSRYLGDVIVSVDRARVQAHAARHSVETEIAFLVVHGVLHLVGYDDHRRDDAAKMMRRQRVLVAEAGFPVAG